MSKFAVILDMIEKGEKFLVLPHIHPDGDTLGSSVALANLLSKMDKKAGILSVDSIPDYLSFMDKSFFITEDEAKGFSADIVFVIDSSDETRFADRALLTEGKQIVNIDHHKTNVLFGDVNHVDFNASSTGEIIFELIEESSAKLDEEMAKALYIAISTDTGHFRYSNTRARTHEYISRILETGIDFYDINMKLYNSKPLEKVKLDTAAVNSMKLFYDNQLSIVTVSRDMMKEAGTNDTENIVEMGRDIDGVEVSVLVTEDVGKIKVSMRSKQWVDVSTVALRHGGGGHIRAAGFSSSDKGLKEIENMLVTEYGQILDNRGN